MEWLKFHFLVYVILYIPQDVTLPRPIRLFDNRQFGADDERSFEILFLIPLNREEDYCEESLTKEAESTGSLFK